MAGGGGVYAGTAALSSGYGSVQWSNERDEEVWVETVVRSTGGLLFPESVAYHEEYRIFPTEHSRAGDTNVVETGTYEVEVTVETKDRSESAGPFTTTWAPAGCHHQTLIVTVTEDLSVEFDQKEC